MVRTCLLALAASAGLLMEAAGLEIIGHRGASYDAPENTVGAFKLSYEQGADATELDVHLTKDNRVVVLHDYDLKRVGNSPLKAAENTLASLQKHSVAAFGKWKESGLEERVPALEDVIRIVPAGKRLFIEIKCHEEVLPALAECFAKGKLKPQQLPIITFHYEVAAAAKKRFPEHEVSWLHGWSKDKENPTVDELIEKAKSAKLDGLDLKQSLMV
jgi:glycerophosphoryl diester phosphodiesterase